MLACCVLDLAGPIKKLIQYIIFTNTAVILCSTGEPVYSICKAYFDLAVTLEISSDNRCFKGDSA